MTFLFFDDITMNHITLDLKTNDSTTRTSPLPPPLPVQARPWHAMLLTRLKLEWQSVATGVGIGVFFSLIGFFLAAAVAPEPPVSEETATVSA